MKPFAAPDECYDIYTTIGGLSSQFDEFLAVQSQFDLVHGADFYTPTSCQSATFVRPLFALYCTLVFTGGIVNNAAFRHRRGDVYAARLMIPPLYGRLIARWRHGRWLHRYGKGSCFNSTRGHTGSLLVITKNKHYFLSDQCCCLHKQFAILLFAEKLLTCDGTTQRCKCKTGTKRVGDHCEFCEYCLAKTEQ